MKTLKLSVTLLALGTGVSGAAQAALHDRGGGLIYDDVLDVTWLQNANYGAGSSYDSAEVVDVNGNYEIVPGSTSNGRMWWSSAVAWAANLSYYDSVRDVTWDDWRLPHMNNIAPCDFYAAGGHCGYSPNVNSGELAHLFFVTLANTAAFSYDGSVSIPGGGLVNAGPFVDLQAGGYWYSTQNQSGDMYSPAWGFNFAYGFQGPLSEDLGRYGQFALAVRDGDVAAVPEAETYALMLAGLGLVGLAARRRKQGRFR